MAKPITIKPEEQSARSYADRLILGKLYEIESAMKLSELADGLSHAGLGLAAVRSLLATNPDRFAYHERRWIPAARLESQGRPTAEAIRLIVDRFGGPMPLSLVIREMSLLSGKDVEDVEPTVRRILSTGRQFAVTSNEEVCLVTWGFDADDETVDRALALNGLTTGDIDEVAKKLGADFDWRAQGAVTAAVKKAAPVSAKALGAAMWLAVNSQDPRSVLIFEADSFLAEAVNVPGYVFGSDGVIHEEGDAKKWLTLAVKVAEKLAPAVDVEDVAPIDVKPEHVTKMVEKILKSENSVTATKLLEEIYEITPSNKTFPDDLVNVMTALKADGKVVWVGGDRFNKPGVIPDIVASAPELFEYHQTPFQDADSEFIDAELTDEGLSSSLRKLLQHPLAMDVLDEEIAPVMKNQPEQVRLVLKSIHREIGTFPMAQLPTGWLDLEPGVQELMVIDPQGRELQIWASHEARLLFGFLDWWFEQPVESGAVFTLTKTTKPNILEFAWDEQTDPVVYISNQRMEELRLMQENLEQMSTLDILIQVMTHWPKGADFLTLLAEVNVVRRSSRRLIASLLSSYQCFYQRSGSPVWHYDAKKVELGFDKSKRKFMKK